jgi:hypothetical protein
MTPMCFKFFYTPQTPFRTHFVVENVALKEMLEEQIRVARALERLLRKRGSGDVRCVLRLNRSSRLKLNRCFVL